MAEHRTVPAEACIAKVVALEQSRRGHPEVNPYPHKGCDIKSRDHGGRYWLHVAERTEQPDGRIHQGQDPARKANQLMHDDGWEDAAEQPPTTTQHPP